MARNIYSFVKIEKRQTRRGIYAAAIGAASMGCLLILVIISFIKGGSLPAMVGALGYLSYLAAVMGLWMSVKLRRDTEAYGRMVHGAFYVNMAAVAVHTLIFLMGCLSIIL